MKVKTRAANPEADSATLDILGFVGVTLVILGMSDVSPLAHLFFLLISSICITKSFIRRDDWPLWIRWWFTFIANSLLVLAAWSFLQRASVMH